VADVPDEHWAVGLEVLALKVFQSLLLLMPMDHEDEPFRHDGSLPHRRTK
jgi:hypothetical protein